jgi:hypothetical protein
MVNHKKQGIWEYEKVKEGRYSPGVGEVDGKDDACGVMGFYLFGIIIIIVFKNDYYLFR